ncbi:polysaccharide lyase family 7 protein [Zeaxanthinibacter sp. PT1]|uniref:polysaccharide lyase family 7 protein n=1 Tax=Zeaxanthinibacter TaxID=561554 RepID=UPI00234B46E6|nr:polysaccharide lyase family 7 protein [Zeaxanthinibacter sp. PT1]MDC6352210.1 polysaccharide lyase family 7 protein [Zeaxanthinibacter sp. PT1]
MFQVEGEQVSGDHNESTTGNNSYTLPDIDLNNWKVTLPIGENNKPIEVEPPEILDYSTNETLIPFMYNDSTDGSLVFYAYPGQTTPNSSKSRTELREQMVAGSNSVNWKFSDGGRMTANLKLDDISKDDLDNYHNVIVMQIHGRLNNEQKELIGQADNNAPPILKVSWNNGRIRLKSKVLKDKNVSEVDILRTSSWDNDEGYNFNEKVDFGKFTIDIEASEGRMVVTLNGKESISYEGIDLNRWEVFENYFKAGNYLQTTDPGAYARVKFYDLKVEH